MALPTGQIRMNEIHVEAGGSSGTQCSMNDGDIRGIINKSASTQSRMGEWHGASANVFDASQDLPNFGGWDNSSYYGTAGGQGFGMSSSNWNANSTSQGYGGTDCYLFCAKDLTPGASYTCEWNVSMYGFYCYISLAAGNGETGFPPDNLISSGRKYQRFQNIFGYSSGYGYSKVDANGNYVSFNGSGGDYWKSANGTFPFTFSGTSYTKMGVFYGGGANSGAPGNVYSAQFRINSMIIKEV